MKGRREEGEKGRKGEGEKGRRGEGGNPTVREGADEEVKRLSQKTPDSATTGRNVSLAGWWRRY
jgi:hypothetical protein